MAAAKNRRKPKRAPEREIRKLLDEAPLARFTTKTRPMLATLADGPFEAPGWIYEVKWDGYRALAFLHKGRVTLLSRNQKPFNEKFYPVAAALEELKLDAVIDGEIVVVNAQGVSDFSALQNWRSESDGELRFYVFDLLWLDGHDLTGLPLTARRQILAARLPPNETVRLSESFGDSASRFLRVAKELGLEGILAKKADSQYYPGERTKAWLKIKASLRQEVLIGGYTRNAGSAKPFSALLVGVMENGKLVYTGKVGTGFNTRDQTGFLKKAKKLVRKNPPFETTPDVNKPSRFRPDPPRATATWLRPLLVAEVNYTEMTADGIMRHPSFIALREDKNPSEVVRENPVKRPVSRGAKKILVPPGKKARKTLLNPTEATQVKTVNGHALTFNNLKKVFWPAEKYTKRDLINYYYQVAPYMLPHLLNRPQSMNRFPNGIHGKSFYQKDVTGKAPPWIETYKYYSEADRREKNFLVCTSEASLLYMISLGCIEINPWHSTARHPNRPTWCIIDLDPDRNTFRQVIDAALVTKEVLDGLGVPSCCKTSGSTGLHIYIPLGAKYTYEQSREFARVIATMVHRQLPSFTSIERAVRRRKGKMYVDFLQNRPQATVAAPYSVRPKPGATVSMPLHWDEVKHGLRIADFTIANAVARLRETGDLFAPVVGKGIRLEKVVKQFSKES